MNLTSKPLAAIILIILFGGIALTTAMGSWQTMSSKMPATYTEGEFAGTSNPADIRGSYLFGDVEKAFGIPSAVLAQAFNVQSNDPALIAVRVWKRSTRAASLKWARHQSNSLWLFTTVFRLT